MDNDREYLGKLTFKKQKDGKIKLIPIKFDKAKEKPNEDDTKFCPRCGISLQRLSVAISNQPSPAAKFGEEVYGYVTEVTYKNVCSRCSYEVTTKATRQNKANDRLLDILEELNEPNKDTIDNTLDEVDDSTFDWGVDVTGTTYECRYMDNPNSY